MKYLSKISFVVTAGLIAILPVLVAVHLVDAAGNGAATFSLSPSSAPVAPGDILDVSVYEDSGTDKINALQANLTYSNSLTFVSLDSTGSAFDIKAQATGGGGAVSIGRGTATPVSGSQFVAKIRFTVNSNASGTAQIDFTSGTALVRSTDNGAESLTFVNGSYTITSKATMSLSPVTKTVSQGTSFDVGIYGDSGSDPVNAVQVNLSYPADKLSYVSTTSNLTDWPVVAQTTGGSGSINIGRGTTTPLTGSHLIATVTFNAIAAGTAQVGIAPGSGMVRSTDNAAEPSTNTGGVYTITSTAPPSGGGGGSTGGSTGGTTSKKSSTSTTPPKSYTRAPSATSAPATTLADTTGPVITDIKVSNVTTKSATVSWTTSEPATSEVDFGPDKSYILSTSDATLATNHSLALDPKELVGHKTYHFVVKSTDNAGNQSTSDDMTFKTGGVQITTTEIAVVAGAAILGGGAWLMAAAGGLKLGGGGMMVAAGGGIYVEPKPIIVGGGTPPPRPTPVVHPQSAAPAQQAQAPAKTKTPAQAPAENQATQTPGKVVGPKEAPASQPDNQTLPKWVKK